MAHAIDTTEGQASFVSAREDAWHRLGITLDSAFTAEEAMQYGRLGGWNVRKTPVFTTTETGEILEVPNRHAVVRDNPVTPGRVDVLGTVGDSYRVIQNEQHADLLNAIVDEGGAHFETAGAINGGRQVFLTMKLPGHVNIGGVDRIENYLAAINSHDGSMAFTMLVTPVRIVCQNTLNLAIKGAANKFSVRHTRGADAAIRTQARKALDITFNYLDEFQEHAERMIQTTMTQTQFEQIINDAFGAPEDAPAPTVTRTENKLDEMVRLFTEEYTQEGIRDTVWAGLNSLTEWFDHYSPTRGDERETARATKAILDPTFKNKALELMLAQV